MKLGRWLAVLALAASASSLNAQEAADARNQSLAERLRPPVTVPAELAPRLTPAEQSAVAAAAPRSVTVVRGRDIALMIAGAALFVGGALVGGDPGTLLMITGVGIGAYGLYLHFR